MQDDALHELLEHKQPLPSVVVLLLVSSLCLVGTGWYLFSHPLAPSPLPVFRPDLKQAMLSSTSADLQLGSSSRIPINRASAAQLEELPGIGPARAQAIMEGRPYQDLSSLQQKAKLPSSVVEAINDKISF